MKKFIKENWFKLSIIIIIIIIFGGGFYWFQLRPTKIKQDCAWIKRIAPATIEEPAITKDDIKNSQLEYDKCVIENSTSKNKFSKYLCEGLLKKEREPIPAKPEQTWYGKATKNEYDTCLREKGL